MVLNEKLGAKPRASIAKGTILYVLGFGLGSLAMAGCLSFAFMSVAEGVMPSKDVKPTGTTAPNIIGSPTDGDDDGNAKLAPKAASKARRGRANEGAGKSADQPL